jgi:hypothetical protein
MFPLSTRALTSLTRSHTQSARVDVLHDGVLVKRLGGFDGSEIPATYDPLAAGFVPAITGTINVSRQQIRRDGTVTFLDLGGILTPDDVDDLLAPFIAEVRPWLGIHYWDATPTEQAAGLDVEWVPLATLVVTGIEGTWPQRQVTGFDRLTFLQPFIGNYPVAAGTQVDAALADLLATYVPSSRLETNIPDTEFVAPAVLYTEQDSSLDAAHALALAMGGALYADPMGVITVQPEASTDDPPVISYAPGPDSMMLRPQRVIDATGAKNVFVVTGENPGGAPIRGTAQDDNPDSLTYVQRIGPRPDFYSSPLMQNPAQCELAAKTRRARGLGIADTIAVPVVPNPALEAGDIIQVRDDDQNINYPLAVDSFNVGLRASDGTMTINCRSRIIR